VQAYLSQLQHGELRLPTAAGADGP
jgi:hypothetical protein